MSNKSTGPKRSRAQREKDLATIGDMLARRKTRQEILEAICAQYEFSLSPKTLSNDVREVVSRWRQEAFKNVASHLASQLATLDAQIRALWQAWQESIGDHIEETEENTEDSYSGANEQSYTRSKSKEKRTPRHGDLRIMSELSRVLDARSKLLGLNAPTRAHINWQEEARRIGIDSQVAQEQFNEMVSLFSEQMIKDSK